MTSGVPDSDSSAVPGTVQSGLQEGSGFNLHSEDVLLPPEEPLKIIRSEPQIPYSLHTHSVAELVIILSGTGEHRMAGECRPIAAGDVYVILGDRAHGYGKLHDLYQVSILFEPTLLENLTFDLSRLPGFCALFRMASRYREGERGYLSCTRLDSSRLDRAMSLVERIEREIECGEDGYRFMAAVHFRQLAGELSRWYSGARHSGVQHPGRISSVTGYLEHHLNETVTLRKLSGLADLSASTLNRAFYRAVGLPPLAYHLRLRIHRAASLLRTTDLSITEIAGQTGFNDANYFSRQFRKTMGFSPGVYRQREG